MSLICLGKADLKRVLGYIFYFDIGTQICSVFILTFVVQVRALPSPQTMFLKCYLGQFFLIRYWLCFSQKLFRGADKLNHFLVLLCGVGFIFVSGLAFLVLRFVEKYPLSNKTQRVLHLAVFIFLAILCILIFDWYSSEYIKSLSESWGLNKC